MRARWIVVSLALSLSVACPGGGPGAEGEGEGEDARCVDDLDCNLSAACDAEVDCDGTACANVEFDDDGVPVDGFVCDPADVIVRACVTTPRGGRCGLRANAERCPAAAFIEDIHHSEFYAPVGGGEPVEVCFIPLICVDGECAQ